MMSGGVGPSAGVKTAENLTRYKYSVGTGSQYKNRSTPENDSRQRRSSLLLPLVLQSGVPPSQIRRPPANQLALAPA